MNVAKPYLELEEEDNPYCGKGFALDCQEEAGDNALISIVKHSTCCNCVIHLCLQNVFAIKKIRSVIHYLEVEAAEFRKVHR